MIEPSTKVLVVDDSDKQRREVREALIGFGFKKDRIEEATDGKEAYARAQEKEYVAIIMDIDMPRCDGKKATVAIRKKGRNTKTTIIAYTSDITPSTTERELKEYTDLGFTYAIGKDSWALTETLKQSGIRPKGSK